MKDKDGPQPSAVQRITDDDGETDPLTELRYGGPIGFWAVMARYLSPDRFWVWPLWKKLLLVGGVIVVMLGAALMFA